MFLITVEFWGILFSSFLTPSLYLFNVDQQSGLTPKYNDITYVLMERVAKAKNDSFSGDLYPISISNLTQCVLILLFPFRLTYF